MMNTKKRKTERGHLFYLPSLFPTYSQSNIPNAGQKNTKKESLVGEIILQIVSQAERMADIHERCFLHFLATLTTVQNAMSKYEQMNMTCEEEPTTTQSQAEPTQNSLSYRQKEKIAQQLKQSKKIKEAFSSRRLMRLLNQKSQSCDINDQQKRKQKYIKQSNELRHGGSKLAATVNLGVRKSEGQDRSTQIQQLLRQKKELQLYEKPIPRNHTQNSRNLSSDRKQRKHYGQDDDGAAFELTVSKRVGPVALVHAVSLANIRLVGVQQVQQGMKKKPIVELLTKRRPKRRRDIGDTCVLIEQLYEHQIPDKYDQEKAIEDVIRPQNGVRLTVKDRSATQQPSKLPNIR